MKTYLLALLLLPSMTFTLALSAQAAGTQVYEQEAEEKVPVKDGYEPLDMSEYQAFGKKDKPASKGQKRISSSCRDITGKDIKPNEPGYETCLQKINPANSKSQTPGSNLNINYGSED